MKKSVLSLSVIALVLASLTMEAQRYATEIFTSNQVESDVTFGANVNPFSIPNVLTDPAGWSADMETLNGLIDAGDPFPTNYFIPNAALPEDQQTVVKLTQLEMDIYTPPAEDEETSRPLMVYIHTGNFLPPLFNGSITGDKIDSAGVNLCKQWARRGFVAISINYRLGWNPTSTDPDVRRGTLLQAVFRALHDTQSAVRYMRATVADGNPYGIDPEKIVLVGQGSGGYVANAYVTLDNYVEEIANLDKFNGNNGPYVIPAIDGDIDGGPGLTRLPDPLQEAGISKEVNMSVNMGGALADISWLDEGEAPMVTFHCIRDPFAPFDDGTVVVPTTNENVVDVSGGNVFIQKANDLNNNEVFAGIEDGDPYTDRARSLYGETFDYILPTQPTITVAESPEGLFPILLPINEPIPGVVFFNEGGPWDWWDLATLEQVVAATNAAAGTDFDAQELHQQGVLGNPDMGPEKGLAFIDTIQGYAIPRVMCALELPGNVCATNVDDEVFQSSTNVYPNPSQGQLTVRNDEHMIRRVELIDITGRTVMNKVVNAGIYTLNRNDFTDGVYLLQIYFDENRITKKVLFN